MTQTSFRSVFPMKNNHKLLPALAVLSMCTFVALVPAADAPAAAPAAAPAPTPDPKAAAVQTKAAETTRADADRLKAQFEKADPAVRAAAEIVTGRQKARADLFDKAAAAYTAGDAAAAKVLLDQAGQIATQLAYISNAPQNRTIQLQLTSEEQFTNWQNQFPLAIDLLKVFIESRKVAAEKYRLLTEIQVAGEFDREAFFKALDEAKQAYGDQEVAFVNWQRTGTIRRDTESMKKASVSSAKMQIAVEAERDAKELIETMRLRNENAVKMQQLSRDLNRVLAGDMPPKK